MVINVGNDASGQLLRHVFKILFVFEELGFLGVGDEGELRQYSRHFRPNEHIKWCLLDPQISGSVGLGYA